MLGAMIQTVTVFDTRRATVDRESMRAAGTICTKTGAITLIPTHAYIDQNCKSMSSSAVQELLSVGWGSA
jgi:hypothetical protein